MKIPYLPVLYNYHVYYYYHKVRGGWLSGGRGLGHGLLSDNGWVTSIYARDVVNLFVSGKNENLEVSSYNVIFEFKKKK